MKLLGNDLVINENDCNLSCQYCLTGQSNMKSSHEEQLIFKTPTRDEYSPCTPLGERLNKISDRMKSSLKTPFLKITGGEVFLVKNIMGFIKKMSQEYQVIVVQTNAVLVLEKHLDELLKIDNLVIQISLDSHLHYGNSYRVAKESLHNKVVNRIEALLRSGLKLEIYSVLNDRSVTEMVPFVKWLHGINRNLVYYPFPVRGPDCEAFQVKEDQIQCIKDFLELYDECSDILPPRPYFKRLLSFYELGERQFRCHLPRLVISSFSDGVVTACPNIWFDHLGNAFDDDQTWGESLEKIGHNGLYQMLLANQPRLKACKGCFTPWDTLSMYFEDEISLDELCEAPTYAPKEIRNFIRQKKEEYLKEQSKDAVSICGE